MLFKNNYLNKITGATTTIIKKSLKTLNHSRVNKQILQQNSNTLSFLTLF